MSAAVSQRRGKPRGRSGRDSTLRGMENTSATSRDIAATAFLLEVARQLDTAAGIYLSHGNVARAERLAIRAAEIRGGVR